MTTLSNAEISRIYKVSKPTVSTWIDGSISGRNFIKLVKVKGRWQIEDNEHNRIELERLRNEGRKHRSYSSLKRVEMPQEFYNTFNPDQVVEIINDLEFSREVNLKYNYFSDGANYWDLYYREEGSNSGKSIEEVLEKSLDLIEYNLKLQKKVNVVDLGPGNAFPTKIIMDRLFAINKLKKYVALDISPELLELSINNINSWFPNLPCDRKLIDLEAGGFGSNILKNRSFEEKICNLTLLFGNTIVNTDDRIQVLKNIRRGMVQGDLFIANYALSGGDTSVNLTSYKNKYAELHGEWLLTLLGFDVDQCEIPLYYDSVNNRKIKSIILDKDYELNFDIASEKRKVLLLEGTEIIRWKQYLMTEEQIIFETQNSGLKIVDLMLDNTKSNALVVCEVAN